jgi:UTP--glucose-1-phosphate uridylyltransferase
MAHINLHVGRDIGNQFKPFAEKMKCAGLDSTIIDTFHYYYTLLLKGETGLLTKDHIEPVKPGEILDLTHIDNLIDRGRSLLQKVALIKLNGGLGTGMGLSRAKSLIVIRDGMSFLDIIVKQVLVYREKYANKIPLILMNSFRTDKDTKKELAKYKSFVTNIPLTFLQHKIPKIFQDSLTPAEWAPDPTLEWNPPGHGEVYTALATSGMLKKLVDAGIIYAFISNSDNLGAIMDVRILGYFAKNNIPFLMEVADRTAADKKGGHIARLKENGRLVLRESAQCPGKEKEQFQDIHLYRYFNTNNIWINLLALKHYLEKNNNVILLPMIRNRKTVDPRDKTSPPVFQIETAMGAAISVFEGATAIRVPRTRFRPVKQCNDLLALWSDCYICTDDYRVIQNPKRTLGTIAIKLDNRYYKMIDQLRARFPEGAPSLIDCESLEIEGDVRFEGNVVIKGKVKIVNRTGKQHTIPKGTMIDTPTLLIT